MNIIKYTWITLLALSCSTSQSQNFEVVTTLPKKIKESSALEVVKGSSLLWTIEDKKNDPLLFGFTKNGQLEKTIRISNVSNHDWEDLTSDNEGNVYIGDFGNNDNQRQNLAIYKIDASELNKENAKASSIVEFYYPEQTDFPPKKSELIYDVESFFFYNDAFYLFTKNRSSKFDGTTILYKVENKSGEKIPAQKISTFKTCNQYSHCAITSAAISPDFKKVALLTSDKVFLLTNFKGDDFFSGKSIEIDLGHYTQKEGIDFENNINLLITDEASKKEGSNLYRLKL